ncbi:MAG: hypothetical protein LC772_12120, partial [Chloroflexi bacterium]|nr:hypothetical protein [Chloroflexota bacterium]
MITSIRWRLTCWYVAILALTLAVLGIAVFLLMRHALYDWVDDGLEGQAGLLAAQVAVRRGEPVLEDQPDEDSTGRDEGYLLLNAGRRVSAAVHIEPRYFVDAPVIRRALSGVRAGGTVIVGGNQRWRAAAFPVVQGGHVVAVVAAVRSLHD